MTIGGTGLFLRGTEIEGRTVTEIMKITDRQATKVEVEVEVETETVVEASAETDHHTLAALPAEK